MFGWEFPPFNSGGLGVACLGLAKGLVAQGVELTFVLPKQFDIDFNLFKLLSADIGSIKFHGIHSALYGYVTPYEYKSKVMIKNSKGIYAASLIEEVMRYAEKAKEIASSQVFDIVHAHDWLAFPAGVAAAMVSGKPLIVHVHATEFDRTGGHNINKDVYEIEKQGMEKADAVVAVSNFTKQKIIEHYGIDARKIRVVHNGVENYHELRSIPLPFPLKQNYKLVLFVGRLTLQKGPDYFLRAAHKVLQYNPYVIFVVSGSGEMKQRLIRESAYLGISDKVFFTDFLRGRELACIYQAADLFVMPSVSEPFGIAALESLTYGTPVLISKQSGVSEVVSHALKVDFWDVDEMAHKILSVLSYPSLRDTLSDNGRVEVRKANWQESARKMIEVYRHVLQS